MLTVFVDNLGEIHLAHVAENITMRVLRLYVCYRNK